ncbi:MAG: class I SAM-dependent methyltransferase [Acidobacteria bacterium]|nr:class I SAM-dependent methyltransferase [Acidobacteriota bacterium]
MKINRRSALAGIALQARAQSSPPVERPRPGVMSAFWEPLDRQMIDWLAPAKSAHVLDAGCGRGDHVRLFAERCRVTGVDLKPELLDYVQGALAATRFSGNATLRQADIAKLPFKDATFDLVWSSHVFHGLRNIAAAARELKRVLRPGGRFALRENRVLSALLPADLGFGVAGLEARADLAFTKWLTEDRAARGRYPHLWGQILRDAGVRDVQAKSFLHEANQPFSDIQREYLRYHLARKREWDLTEADKQTLHEITDPASPRYVLNRPDLYYVSVSTIYLGIA